MTNKEGDGTQRKQRYKDDGRGTGETQTKGIQTVQTDDIHP